MKLLRLLPALVLLALISLISSCANGEAAPKTPINPNGDSELALLMRKMYNESLKAKEALLAGEAPTLDCEVARLHTASATEPDKVARPEYAGFATSFEVAVASMEKAPFGHRDEAYDQMVNSCIQCHQELCPGPIRRINKLRLSDKERASLP